MLHPSLPTGSQPRPFSGGLSSAVRATGFLFALFASVAIAGTVPIDPNAPIRLAPDSERSVDKAELRLHGSLARLQAAHARREVDLPAASGVPAELIEDGRVLVEVRTAPGSRAAEAVDRLGGELRYQFSSDMFESWLPIHRLDELGAEPGVVRVWPARMVQFNEGSVTSEGVAAGNADLWHAGALEGEGITIAIIDSFANNDGEINELQASGDWPPDSRLTTVKIGNGSFGNNGIEHGNAVLEIAYDTAPGASFIAYDTRTLGNWREAIDQAIDAGADIISASLGAPLDGIGDGSALPGSVAEAVEAAEAAGVIYINAAGNSREQHWGGLYESSAGANANLHAWDGQEMEVNFFGPGNGNAFCLSDDTLLRGELFWDDWDDVDHDYDLILLEFFDGSGWQEVARSNDPQIGVPGQRPQEFLQVSADSGDADTCGGTHAGVYGWSVLDDGAATARNLQFFTNIRLDQRVEARSLGFPADSPSAISVAAINVSNSVHERYSSEGPILAPGGGLPTGSEHPKPDLASFAAVSTVTTTNFAGTSASAPHVAGMAALLKQRHPDMTSSELFERLQLISSIGSNDLGDAGHDFQHGHGRLRFQAEDALVINQQPTDTESSQIIEPPVEVEILDDEGLPVVSGPTVEIDGGLGSDPSGGTATLNGTTIRPVVDGLTLFDNLSIDTPGTGYTLAFNSIGAGSVESDGFEVIDTTPVELSFSVQPGETQVNDSIAPSIVVQVLDANGNVVTDDNETEVELTLVAGRSDAVLSGSGPVVVSNGEAVFDAVSIDEVDSGYQLEAADLSGALEAGTSIAFDIIAGDPDRLVFVVQPEEGDVDEVINPPVEVEVRDAFGNLVDWDNATEVTLTLSGGNPDAVLSGGGPVTVSGGLAVFDALSIDRTGVDYQLNAADESGTLGADPSSFFDVIADRIFSDRFQSPGE